MPNMGNFNRGGRSGTGRSFGGRRDFNRGSDRPTLHKAICSKCGKECEVPFRPTGAKPVFCRDCFRDNGAASDSRRPEGNFPRQSFNNRGRSQDGPQYKEQFEALNTKLDKILGLLTPNVAKEEMVQEVNSRPEERIVIPEKKKKTKKAAPTPEEQV